MITAILSGITKAAVALMSSVLTEVLFTKIIARLVVSLLERIVKATSTTIDDEFAAPIIKKLKENY